MLPYSVTKMTSRDKTDHGSLSKKGESWRSKRNTCRIEKWILGLKGKTTCEENASSVCYLQETRRNALQGPQELIYLKQGSLISLPSHTWELISWGRYLQRPPEVQPKLISAYLHVLCQERYTCNFSQSYPQKHSLEAFNDFLEDEGHQPP